MPVLPPLGPREVGGPATAGGEPLVSKSSSSPAPLTTRALRAGKPVRGCGVFIASPTPPSEPSTESRNWYCLWEEFSGRQAPGECVTGTCFWDGAVLGIRFLRCLRGHCRRWDPAPPGECGGRGQTRRAPPFLDSSDRTANNTSITL